MILRIHDKEILVVLLDCDSPVPQQLRNTLYDHQANIERAHDMVIKKYPDWKLFQIHWNYNLYLETPYQGINNAAVTLNYSKQVSTLTTADNCEVYVFAGPADDLVSSEPGDELEIVVTLKM